MKTSPLGPSLNRLLGMALATASLVIATYQSGAQIIYTNENSIDVSSAKPPARRNELKLTYAGGPMGAGEIDGSNRVPVDVSQFYKIEMAPGQGRADFGRHKVTFSSTLEEPRPVVVVTPDGRVIGFRPSFLAYHDSSNGRSVLLGEANRSRGELLSTKQMIYPNAFTDIDADIRYDCGVNSMEQNILLRQQPEAPATFGLNEDTTHLEMWTEVFADPPVAEKSRINLRSGTLLGSETTDDTMLDFGTMKIVKGKAFQLEDTVNSIPVAKEWQEIDGRKFLIEIVDYRAIRPALQVLPRMAQLSPDRAYPDRKGLFRAFASIDTKRKMATQYTRFDMKRSAAVVLDFTIVAAVPVPSGAVAWWSAGGTTNDSAGSNDATLMGGADYAEGEVGQGFNVYGTPSYVKIPRSSSLNLTNSLTIEFWMKASGSNAMNTMQGLVTSDFYGVEISNGWGGTMGVNFFLSGDDGATWPMISTANGGGAPLSSNTWHHIAATYDGTNMQLYVDGQPWGDPYAYSGTVSSMPTNGFLAIGSESGRVTCGCDRYFNGVIDEVTIYNRALGASEIEMINAAGQAGKYNPNCVTPSTNAVGWWPLDGNGYDLARTNFATLYGDATFVSGCVGTALSLDGNGDYAQVANSALLNPTNITVECWLYRRALVTTWDPVIKKVGNGNSDTAGYSLEFNGNYIMFWLYNNGWKSSASSYIQNNRWYHVAGVYTGTNILLYVDGQPIGLPYALTGSIATSTNSLRIGNDSINSDRFFDGVVDEATVYNRALTGTEISAIYAAGSAGKCKVDTDADGLTDLQENFLETNPNNPDTDGDGVMDGDELFVHHTNPKNQDSDGDGMVDQPFKVHLTTPRN